jgi:Na+-transporting NADH:ubiquinone oxidoreductase subunit A
MALHRIKKGLDLPISGEPEQSVEDARPVRHVAVVASDFVGMKPRWEVQDGDVVKRGSLLFEDRKSPGVRFTAPASGRVSAIHRGAKRALQSVVIELNDNELNGTLTVDDFERLEAFAGVPVAEQDAGAIRALLLESGLWTSFRTRPFNRVPTADSSPAAIFVTAIDTDPLAPSVETALAGRHADFVDGLRALAGLEAGTVYLCRRPGAEVGAGSVPGVSVENFVGPHPAGLAGTHIHLLAPVSRGRTVWHIGYNDVADIGELFRTGRMPVDRVISLAGPGVKKPRLLRTRIGASVDALVQGELHDGEARVISGSVLSGTIATGEAFGYLGRYARQITVLHEGRKRHFMGWMAPGFDIFSIVPTFMSALFPDSERRFEMTTDSQGSLRAMVPIGTYEEVMPLDIMPTHLLRSLICGDLETSEQLGCLELAEEDLALCTVVCPGKYDYGPILRKTLNTIAEEG